MPSLFTEHYRKKRSKSVLLSGKRAAWICNNGKIENRRKRHSDKSHNRQKEKRQALLFISEQSWRDLK